MACRAKTVALSLAVVFLIGVAWTPLAVPEAQAHDRDRLRQVSSLVFVEDVHPHLSERAGLEEFPASGDGPLCGEPAESPALENSLASKLDPQLARILRRARSARPLRVSDSPCLELGPDGYLTAHVFVRVQPGKAGLVADSIQAVGGRVGSVLPTVITTSIPPRGILDIASMPTVTYVESAPRVEYALDVSVPAIGADMVHSGAGGSPGAYQGTGVIVGVVDSGIDWSHDDFRKADGSSRILFIWDQTDHGGPSPSEFPSAGTEWTKAQLDNELDGTPAGVVRETDTLGHGTHVAGIAAGNGQASAAYLGVAPDADLIIVKTTFFQDEIVNGINYIFQKAAGRGQPAVVNLSLGSNWGPHDNTSSYETAVNSLVGPGKIVCMSAGNSGDNFVASGYVPMATHASYQNFNSDWRFTAPIAVDSFYIDMWNEAGTITVALQLYEVVGGVLESCATTPDVGPGSGGSWTLSCGGSAVGTVVIDSSATSHPYNGCHNIIIGVERMVSPDVFPEYFWFLWTNGSGRLDMWIPYDGVAIFYDLTHLGAQAADADKTVSGGACARNVIAVGSYITKPGGSSLWEDTLAEVGSISDFSSIGPSRKPAATGRKPEIAAPGEIVMAALSSDWDGQMQCFEQDAYGNYCALQGTSMAAPHVSGALALMLERDPMLTPADVESHLGCGASSDGHTGSVPNNIWGDGKLQAVETINCFTPSCPNGCFVDNQCRTSGELNPANECEHCDPSASEDAWTPVSTGTPCDDDNACHVGEACAGGVCTGGLPVNCDPYDTTCADYECDASGGEGNCADITPINESLDCDDGDACRVGETCQSGVCTGGSAVNCPDNGDFCTAAVCDSGGSEGNCDAIISVNEGTACDDGDVCNVQETCQSGVCAGGFAVNCPDNGDACTDYACDSSGAEGNCDAIVDVNEGETCDDGDVCNVGETCQGGFCTGGTLVSCSSHDTICGEHSCDPSGSEGNCDLVTPINEGLACDDGDACNVDETCQGGACTGGSAVTCPDNGDFCTDYACNSNGNEGNCDAVVNVNEGSACDDGDVCNVGETCQGGICTAGSAVTCPDNGHFCTIAVCDLEGNEGNCDALLIVNEGLACDDGDVCNVGETCQGGSCTGGSPVNCDPYDTTCADYECDPGGSEGNCGQVTALNEGLVCDDGDVCNVGETCQGGSCAGGSPVNCDPHDTTCADCECDPNGDEGNCADVTAINEGEGCDDGLFCNGMEACSGGSCVSSGNPCPGPDGDDDCAESCDERLDDCTGPDPNGSPCDDLLYCNGVDVCLGGSCAQHAGDPCPDERPECDEERDKCIECFEATDCDDNDPCTVDSCVNTYCGNLPKVCPPDDDPCTLDLCVDGECRHLPMDCGEGQVCKYGACESVTWTLTVRFDVPGLEPSAPYARPCEDSYVVEQAVPCLAPEIKALFVCWEGDVPPGQETADPLVLVMDCDKTVTARFQVVECLEDADCPEGGFCIDSTCQDCREDGDCDDGLYCNGAETCVDGGCSEGEPPCGVPEACDEDTGRCVSVGCGAMGTGCGPTGPSIIMLFLGLATLRLVNFRYGGRR